MTALWHRRGFEKAGAPVEMRCSRGGGQLHGQKRSASCELRASARPDRVEGLIRIVGRVHRTCKLAIGGSKGYEQDQAM